MTASGPIEQSFLTAKAANNDDGFEYSAIGASQTPYHVHYARDVMAHEDDGSTEKKYVMESGKDSNSEMNNAVEDNYEHSVKSLSD